ncbi:MAG: autotransporter domain-containing protein [Candidatus Omnitrophota bacterium]|jgi:uncharacterized protein with beta-barrel porin domain
MKKLSFLSIVALMACSLSAPAFAVQDVNGAGTVDLLAEGVSNGVNMTAQDTNESTLRIGFGTDQNVNTNLLAVGIQTNSDGKGNVLIVGTSTINGTVGASGKAMDTISGGDASDTVTFAGAVVANALNVTGTGTIMLDASSTIATTTISSTGTLSMAADADLTGAVAFTDDGTIALAAGSDLTGNVTTGTGGNGNITTAGNSIITGTVGTSAKRTGSITASGASGTTAEITGAVYATDATVGAGTLKLDAASDITTTTVGAGTLNLSTAAADLTGTTLTFTGDGLVTLADGSDITAAITNTSTTANKGNVTTAGDSKITGAVGLTGVGRLGSITVSGGATSTAEITGAVYATDATIGAGTLQLDTTSDITTVSMASGILSMAADADLTGAVAFTDDGTIAFSDGSDLVGSITTGTGGNGNITTAGNSIITGTVGTAVNRIGSIDVSGASGTTAEITGAIYATDAAVATGAMFQLDSDADITALTITGGLRVGGNIATTGTWATAAAATSGIYLQGNTMTHAGALTFGADSYLNLDIASNTSFGNVIVTGIATIPASVKVDVNVTGVGFITNGRTFTVVDGNAGSGVAGGNTVTDNSSVLTFTATTDSSNQDLILTASRANPYNKCANNPNAAAAGTALEAAGTAGATGDMLYVLNTLDSLPTTSQVAGALDSIVPEVDAGVINITMNGLNKFVGASIDRLEKGPTFAKNIADSAMTGFSAGDASKLSGIWAKGYGSYLTQGTRQNIQGYNAWDTGTAIGIDHLFSDVVTLGMSGGYTYGNIDSNINNASTSINSAQGTLYAGYQGKDLPVFVDVAGSFAYNWYNGNRDIDIGGIILRTANAQYDGQQYGVYVGSGYSFGIMENVEFTPLVSLQWNHLYLGKYTETGAGALSLDVSSQSYDQLQSGLGARLASLHHFKWGTMTMDIHGKWFYDFIGDSMVVTSTFTGGGPSFDANGFKPAQSSFNAGGQLAFCFQDVFTITVDCDTEMMDEFFGIYGGLTLRYNF